MVEIGVQKIADFATKMPNSNCKTSESKSTESSATSSTDFSSESDPSSSTESSESETDNDNGDLYNSWTQILSIFFRIIVENYTFFLQFSEQMEFRFLSLNSAKFYRFPLRGKVMSLS